MTTIKHENNIARVYNELGAQVVGTNAPNLEGLNPKELLEASLALCTTITIRKLLERDGVDYNADTIQATVVASKDEGGANRFTNFEVALRLPEGLDKAYKKKLLISAERGCTISNTIKAQTQVKLIDI